MIGRHFIKLLFWVCMLGCSSNMYAQSNEEVKTSGKYVWGEGSGVTTEKAEATAMAQMSRSISVSIIYILGKKKVNNEYTEERVLQTISAAKFRNVQIRVLEEEPEARVLCFMDKDEVGKVLRQREDRILDLVETGKKAEERLQIDDALRCYYWALVLSKLNPDPVNVEFAGQEGQASSLLPVKIKSVLQMLKAEVVEGGLVNNRVDARVKFTYNGKDVSSLQFKYNDGQSIVGPVVVKDGIGEVELVGFPANEKLRLVYETRFRNEIDPADGDLNAAFGASQPKFDSTIDVAMKLRGGEVKAGNEVTPVATASQALEITPEAPRIRKPIEMRRVNNKQMFDAVLKAEEAIKNRKPEQAFQYFTPEGYQLFSKMLKTGQVTLSGKSDYEFVEADNYVIGRATHVKVKYKTSKAFMEDIVYRFDPSSGKIVSVAFALSKRAENDIMNAAAKWPEVSRWVILNFMEDYQTAFAMKRLDFISSIFSDNALIITGTVLKSAGPKGGMLDQSKLVKFSDSPTNVKYSKYTKEEYINRLSKIFKQNEFVHLSFEDNVTNMIEMPSNFDRGAAFGIQIRQRYASQGYSDEGYLTLFLDTRGESPIIRVRLWQPDYTEMITLQKFISNFNH